MPCTEYKCTGQGQCVAGRVRLYYRVIDREGSTTIPKILENYVFMGERLARAETKGKVQTVLALLIQGITSTSSPNLFFLPE